MILFVCRFLLTIVYAVFGLKLALPLSYFFQDSIYHEMSFSDYIGGGFSSIVVGAEFGAYEVYRMTVIISMILAIVIGKWIERQISK